MAEVATLLTSIAAFIAAASSAILAWRAKAEVKEVHLSVNSRLDELVASTREAAHAAGLQEGRDEK